MLINKKAQVTSKKFYCNLQKTMSYIPETTQIKVFYNLLFLYLFFFITITLHKQYELV
ncbi:hypothetical protein SAMN03080602_00908 [Arenibacter troitsensis]|uniref:Uncharacterized protein n=1 Tax=Arenibacter troitsensis TaxID=188872 RepID=A0A1X7IKD9_9FLAO|nr:hypothetical protein SAMN03080602_00908 [Arenibacter troitsensis]